KEKKIDTAVIIPVYNEASVIGPVIAKVKKNFDTVVCVNDGSRDDSSNQILKAEGILLEHVINLGAGAATQTGIDYALQNPKTKYFITIDADGQHEIDDAIQMLKHLKQKDLDIILGSRFLGTV